MLWQLWPNRPWIARSALIASGETAGGFPIAVAFAIIIVLALPGLTLFGTVALVERLLVPWHTSQRAPPPGRAALQEPARWPNRATSPPP